MKWKQFAGVGHMQFGFAMLAIFNAAFAAPPWEDPEVNSVNRLAARSIVVPCADKETAEAIARLERPRETSQYLMSLNGDWDFTWVSGKSGEEPRKAKIAVPGCWQLQGDFDPPLYTNAKYPFAIRPPVASGETPENPDWTINRFPDPVGVYEREFVLPSKWEGRRIVVHFGGVSSAMTLFVNGKQVGYSEDSRLPAEFDITGFLSAKDAKGEKNVLKVEVRKFCDGSYLEDQDFWRLSGIFRDVWLVAEKKDGLSDFTIATDAKTGAVTVRDDDGDVIHTETVSPFELWSPDNPKLYCIAFQHGGDWFARCVGFRTVEIRDKVLLVNGKRIFVKGVNRHEISPEGGYAMTHAEMDRDMRAIKEFGFNSVRTCHYPDDPYWYDLCDKYGLYVTCEANIESHGMYYNNPAAFSKQPDWEKAHLERGGRMVEVFRDHPSIIVWSLGNECDMGPAFKKEYALIKSLDPQKRPVQFEQALKSPWSDIYCPMYATAKNIEKYVADPEHVCPAILCEYAHAMGNSSGSFKDYWDNVEKYPSAQGGYVWDFADQALWQTMPDGSRRLAYGGDFGDMPNSGDFCCNGVFDALRRPHPGAYEMKAVMSRFKDWEIRPRPNFWRAFTSNDKGWKMMDVCKVWRDATITGKLPEGCRSDLKTEVLPDGSLKVDWRFFAPEGLSVLPRVGLTFTIPGSSESVVSWHGYGPYENYCDRLTAATVGDWSMKVGELNPNNYINPCEQGYRTGTTRLEVDGITVETCGEPFGFNVWPWSQDELERAKHVEDLVEHGVLTVNIDAAQMGVGGDNSWGARPHDEHLIKPGREYSLSFRIRQMK